MRVDVKSELLDWALKRSGKTETDLPKDLRKFPLWVSGEAKPTLKQLERFANAVHVPIGYLFLSKPSEEPAPIPDFRTIGSTKQTRLSPNLLDTIYLCQRRQDWYREYAQTAGEDKCEFVGTATTREPIEAVAAEIRNTLAIDLEEQHQCSNYEDALRLFRNRAEAIGVLVMMSSVVGSNTSRKLEPEEFRGFALADEYAPLVFVNSADTKAAQMFTLVHELAHIWLGQSAVSDASLDAASSRDVELWCNAVAAETLVPMDALREKMPAGQPLEDCLRCMAGAFKVSTLVILRRMFDAKYITWDTFQNEYDNQVKRALAREAKKKSSGGNFGQTGKVRASERFITALVTSTLEGNTLYRDAFDLLAVQSRKAFASIIKSVGVSTDGLPS